MHKQPDQAYLLTQPAKLSITKIWHIHCRTEVDRQPLTEKVNPRNKVTNSQCCHDLDAMTTSHCRLLVSGVLQYFRPFSASFIHLKRQLEQFIYINAQNLDARK
jgi:hypothetical protein